MAGPLAAFAGASGKALTGIAKNAVKMLSTVAKSTTNILTQAAQTTAQTVEKSTQTISRASSLTENISKTPNIETKLPDNVKLSVNKYLERKMPIKTFEHFKSLSPKEKFDAIHQMYEMIKHGRELRNSMRENYQRDDKLDRSLDEQYINIKKVKEFFKEMILRQYNQKGQNIKEKSLVGYDAKTLINIASQNAKLNRDGQGIIPPATLERNSPSRLVERLQKSLSRQNINIGKSGLEYGRSMT